MTQSKRLGLALGGGGARGLASIGVLQVLEEAGLEISAIAGTSMGGLIGAFYGAGIPLPKIAALTNHGGPRQLLSHLFDLTISAQGFLRGERIRASFRQALGDKIHFHQLAIPLALVAADLRSGREVVLKSGLLVEALRATCAVPGVFLPVDYEDMALVDGGIVNNVPADVVRQMGVDVVLAVNVLPDFSQNVAGQQPSVLGLRQRGIPAHMREQIHIQMIMLSAITAQRLAQARPEIVLQPNISERVGLFVGYDRSQETMEAGARSARECLSQLRDLLA